jgi:hypothetical protein
MANGLLGGLSSLAPEAGENRWRFVGSCDKPAKSQRPQEMKAIEKWAPDNCIHSGSDSPQFTELEHSSWMHPPMHYHHHHLNLN